MTHYMAIVVSDTLVPANKKLDTHNLIKAAYSCEQIVSEYHENIRLKNYNGVANNYVDFQEYMENYDLPWPYHDSYSYGGRYNRFFDEVKESIIRYTNAKSQHPEWSMIAYNSTIIRDILPYTQSIKFTPSIIVFPKQNAWPSNRYIYNLEDMDTQIENGFFTQMLAPYINNVAFVHDWHM